MLIVYHFGNDPFSIAVHVIVLVPADFVSSIAVDSAAEAVGGIVFELALKRVAKALIVADDFQILIVF